MSYIYIYVSGWLWISVIYICFRNFSSIIFPRPRLTFANDQAVRQKDLGHHLRKGRRSGCPMLVVDIGNWCRRIWKNMGKIWGKYGKIRGKPYWNIILKKNMGTVFRTDGGPLWTPKNHGWDFPSGKSTENWELSSAITLNTGEEIMLEKILYHVVTWCDNNMATIYSFTEKVIVTTIVITT